MLKNISNLGSVLNKSEQQSINGGKIVDCELSADPITDWCCHLPKGCRS